MWWKSLSVVLILYTILAGLRVPLKSGIIRSTPYTITAGKTTQLTFYGYNTRFAAPTGGAPIRVWLTYNEKTALAASAVAVLNDTVLQASFTPPLQSPDNKTAYHLNAILDHPEAGASILPDAVTVDPPAAGDTATTAAGWADLVQQVHVQKGFSFPYQNIIYETIRCLYFHVPMWFALMFLFVASVFHSIRYLGNNKAEADGKAAAYAETGLLFGFLGLLTGMIWANYTWGKPWSNDIKQLMTAVALLIYLAYFILRRSFDDPEKGARLAAVYNIFAFASLVPLLYIVPRMFASLHPGATGNPAFGTQDLDNTMRAVFYPAVLGWILLGFWIAELRARYQSLKDRLLGLE